MAFFATMHYFVVYHYSGDPAAPLFIYGAYAVDPPFQYTAKFSSNNAFETNVQMGTFTIDVVLTNLTGESYSWRNVSRSPSGQWYAVAPLFVSTPPIGHPTCYYINRTIISCTFASKPNFYISADLTVTVIINATSLSGPSVYCDETSDSFKTQTVKNKGQYLFFGWPKQYEGVNIPVGTPVIGSVTHDGINYTAELRRRTCDRNLFAADSKTITWPNAPPGLLSANLDAKGVLEVLHYPVEINARTTWCIYDIYFKAYYLNGTRVTDRKLEYLVFDGEGTNGNDESIIVTTDGTPFTMVELFGTGIVKSTGVGTHMVTFFDTDGQNTFPVFSSTGKDIHFKVETIIAGGQGSAFAVRVFCDYSNKGVPNYMNPTYIISENKEIGNFIISNFITQTPSATPTESLSTSVSDTLSPSESHSQTVSDSVSQTTTAGITPYYPFGHQCPEVKAALQPSMVHAADLFANGVEFTFTIVIPLDW
eukprot:Tbor_TRINITY_DN5734_c1_g3::TRINITY_DN5734_c1_g3_i7::g.20838::m.20838